jgi:hypothetical protein
VDWLFLALMAGGLGSLAIGARRRAAGTGRRSARLGMTPRADLTRIPAEMQRTVLWTLCDGGTERSVVGGRLSLAAQDIDVTCFDLEDLRRKRFQWAWLDVAAPFRLHTPLTVVACTVPRRLPHLLIKRAGPADRIEPRDHERSESRTALVTTRGAAVAGAAGDLLDAATTGLATRAAFKLVEFGNAAEAPPRTLARDTLAVEIDGPWRAWAGPDAGEDIRRLVAALGHGLEIDARDRELVVETLGPLVLAYAASGGPLAEGDIEDLVDAAVGVCERALAATPDLGPRGVEG